MSDETAQAPAPPERALLLRDVVEGDDAGWLHDAVLEVAYFGGLLIEQQAQVVRHYPADKFTELGDRYMAQRQDRGKWDAERAVYILKHPLGDLTELTFHEPTVNDLVGCFLPTRSTTEIAREVTAKTTGVPSETLDDMHIGDWLGVQVALRPFIPSPLMALLLSLS